MRRRRSRGEADTVGPTIGAGGPFAEPPEIVSMGRTIFDPLWGETYHRSGNDELLHVVRGTLSLRIGRGRYDAGPGDTLFVPRGSLHCDRFDTERGLEVFIVFFRWAGSAAFARRVGNRALLALPASRKRGIARLCERMRADRRGWGDVDRLLARALLHAVLMFALRETAPAAERPPARGADAAKRRGRLIRRAREYLAAHLHEWVSLDAVARALGVSPYHLSHVFSEETDFSLFSYLNVLRMERAEALLARGGMRVRDVARAVGFSDANYFSKAFRRHFGRPPGRFLGGRQGR